MKTLSITAGLCVLLATVAMAQSGSSGTVRGYGFDMYGSYRSYTANFGVDQSVPPRHGRILVYHHPMHRYHRHAAATAH